MKNTNHSISSTESRKGAIGKYNEDGFPVLLRFINEMPDSSTTSKLPWFTMVSWKYDGSGRNGMPSQQTNKKMLELERALNSKFDENIICRHAYNRTGNSLKEFNFYISDRDEFMNQLNDALDGHEAYPIEIEFYEDPDWLEMKRLFNSFK